MSGHVIPIIQPNFVISNLSLKEKPFHAVSHGLKSSFRLTNFSDPECKDLKKLQTLWKVQVEKLNSTADLQTVNAFVTPTRFPGVFMVQPMSNLPPVIDDPYLLGKIACLQILGQLYGMGISTLDSIQMILGIPNTMSLTEQRVIVPLLEKGFSDAALIAGKKVSACSTSFRSSFCIGGVGTKVLKEVEFNFLYPGNAVLGDVLVLTKPLGTYVATNAFEWLEQPHQWDVIQSVVTKEEVKDAFVQAKKLMTASNKNACELMRTFQAHCATDVAQFGLLGHAQALVQRQTNNVSFVIHNLPVIKKMISVDIACGRRYQLQDGLSPEISGGLLICLPRSRAEDFCKCFEKIEGNSAVIVGIVSPGEKVARLIEIPRVFEI